MEYGINGLNADNKLNSDMKRTEYRIQYNTLKPLHYKGSIISDGKLKKKESNYKHTWKINKIYHYLINFYNILSITIEN